MRTTTKSVVSKIQEHVLESFGKDNDWSNDTPVENLKYQINSMQYGNRSQYQTAKDLVEGGAFLVYYYDVNNFMNGLDINDKKKDYTDTETWNLYIHLLAREICKLIN